MVQPFVRVNVAVKINALVCLGFGCYTIKSTNEISKVTLPVAASKKKHILLGPLGCFISKRKVEKTGTSLVSVSHEEPGQTATITVVTNPFLFLKCDSRDVGKKRTSYTK